MQSSQAIHRGETREERDARHATIRAQAQRQKEIVKSASTSRVLLGLVLVGLELVVKLLWAGIIFLFKGIGRLVHSIYQLILKYPRYAAAVVLLGTSLWIANRRVQQGFAPDDKFFLGFGLVTLLVGIYLARAFLKANRHDYKLVGSGFMAFLGTWMLYLGFF